MTAATIISQARVELRDTEAPYRWSDAQLLGFLSDGQLELVGRRPDAKYLTSIVVTAVAALNTATVDLSTITLSVRDEFAVALMAYVVGRALQTDQEHAANREAANVYFAQFTGLLT